MPDFNVRSDSVDVEQIMEQIRARIREKRGVDYTEAQIRELAAVKLEKFLDPQGVRSDLLDEFRRTPPAERPNYSFEEDTLFETHRGIVRWIRKLLQPILKLFFNPNPLIQALHIQSRLNTLNAEREATLDRLHYELIHNLVVESTRLGIEVKNLKMRMESFASRLEFNERRARALESVVAYKSADQPVESEPAAETAIATLPPTGPSLPAAGAGHGAAPEGPGQRSRRRRRRRGRRGGGSSAAAMLGPPAGAGQAPQPPPRSNAGSERVTTVDQALTPEAQPSEPRIEGAPERPPTPSSSSGSDGDSNPQ